MAGGLINIATYGSQDLYLTGTPEITYFKIVYRRHTNYAMESVRLKFDDSPDFDKFTTLTFPKAGDLIHKMYLEVILPEVSFQRQINTNKVAELQNLYNQYLNEYEIIQCFMQLNVEAYRRAYEIYKLDNITDPQEMINEILKVFSSEISLSDNFCSDISSIISSFIDILENTKLSIDSPILDRYILCKFFYDCVSLLYIAEHPTTEMISDKTYLMSVLTGAINTCKLITEYFQWLIYITNKNLLEEKNLNYKSAWVKRIGHSIIEYVNIYIGGDIIDKHYGEWIDIWYELTGNKDLEEAYMKMIGNIPELTTFDRTVKPKTTLYVPLIFWFNRFNGQALPLVSMQYHDVQIGLKLRKFSELFYIEDVGQSFNLDNLYIDGGYQLNVNLLTDFIYLDTTERRKFAQSGHEYLIDIIQAQFDENTLEEFKIKLEFTNPSKEIYWIVQRQSLLSNPNGTTECLWTNYGVYTDETVNPCREAQIFINGNKLMSKSSYGYFNHLQPFYCHTTIPKDGVNSYSFCFMPEEHQPSGSCNMSRLSFKQLIIDLDPDMLFELDRTTNKITNIPETTIFKMFSLSQNILRILGGMGSLAFT